jgi:hypothetical protein
MIQLVKQATENNVCSETMDTRLQKNKDKKQKIPENKTKKVFLADHGWILTPSFTKYLCLIIQLKWLIQEITLLV